MGVRSVFQFPGRVFKKWRLRRRGLSLGVSRKTGEVAGFVNHLERSRLARAATCAAFVVVAVLIVWAGGYYSWPWLTVGQRAMEDVYASIDFTFRDDTETARLRQKAAQEVPPVYKLDDNRIAADLDKLIGLLKKPAESEKEPAPAGDPFGPVSEILDSLAAYEVRDFIATPDAAALLARLRPIVLKTCQYRISSVPVGFPAQETGVEVRSVDNAQRELRESIGRQFASPVTEGTRRLLESIACDLTSIFALKNWTEDAEAERKLQAFAMKSVPEQFTTIQQGKKIIARGEEIAPSHLAQIEEMRRALSQKRSPAARALGFAGTAVAVCVLTVGSAVFLAKFHGRVFASNKHLALIAVLILMSVGTSKALMYLRPASAFLGYPLSGRWGSFVLSVFLGYPITVPFGSFVLSMMMGLQLAAFATIPMALLLGMSFGSSLPPVLVGILGGWTAAFFAGSVRHRRDFVRTGLLVGVVNGVMIAAIGALAGASLVTLMVQAAGGVLVAMGSILLAAVFLPLFEWIFKVPTSVTLVELTDSNHPLLKRMIMEAPGSYYHSLMVGNLAESAAEVIGANPLLARVGSYFHDIGKLKKPLYFSENEAFGRSKHDTLNPSMSNLVILSHVKDGVDLACKHNLSKPLLDIIRQHHGTSLDYFFYRRAEEINGDSSVVDEKEFRYPGPKPQSRESAIIMLADSVEAASRSLEKPTTAKICGVVKNIIRMRLEDGQLDECDLTLKDLHRIEETFNRILLSSLHQRVKYPEEAKETKGKENERPVQELAEGGRGAPE
jgi:hypothetical protein